MVSQYFLYEWSGVTAEAMPVPLTVICAGNAISGVEKAKNPLFCQLRYSHAAKQKGFCMANGGVGGRIIHPVNPGAADE